MPSQTSHEEIVSGLIIFFDVFDRKDIDRVNEQVSEILGLQPKVSKSQIHETNGARALTQYITYSALWEIESLQSFLDMLIGICDRRNLKCDLKLLKRYVENCQVRGYDNPSFPAYVLSASIVLKKGALNKSRDLRKDLYQVAFPLRLFIESFDGLTRYSSGWTPRATVITQLWIKTSRANLKKLRETEMAFMKGHEHVLGNLERAKEFSETLRHLEPVDLSATVGDVHSHILNGENVMMMLGHMQQIALGGLRTPYILTLSYEESLLPSNPLEYTSMWMGLPVHSLDNIIWQGYSCLVYLISLSIYLNFIAFKGARIDKGLSKLRDSISEESSHNTIGVAYKHLSELSKYGTQISSLLGLLGAFSRQWEGSVRHISEGQALSTLEVPVLPIDDVFLSSYINFLAGLDSRGGYLETLSRQIILSLEGNRRSLGKQESEVAALRMHTSDIVNLETSRANLLMSKRIERLTWVTVFLSVLLAADTLARVLPKEMTLGLKLSDGILNITIPHWILYLMMLLLVIVLVYIFVYKKK